MWGPGTNVPTNGAADNNQIKSALEEEWQEQPSSPSSKKIECYGILILLNVKTLISNNQFTTSGFFVSVSALKIKAIVKM